MLPEDTRIISAKYDIEPEPRASCPLLDRMLAKAPFLASEIEELRKINESLRTGRGEAMAALLDQLQRENN